MLQNTFSVKGADVEFENVLPVLVLLLIGNRHSSKLLQFAQVGV